MRIKTIPLVILFFAIINHICLGQKSLSPSIQKYLNRNIEESTNFEVVVSTQGNLPRNIKIIRLLNDSTAIILSDHISSKRTNSSLKSYPANNEWKLADGLLKEKSDKLNCWIIKVLHGSAFIASAKKNGLKYIQQSSDQYFLVFGSYTKMRSVFLTDKNIIFIDRYKEPMEEMVISNISYSANNITVTQDRYPDITGKGINISVKENRFDTLDIDFKGRFFNSRLTSPRLTTHATLMATLIGGCGNSFYTGKGVAPGSYLTSADFQNLLPESNEYYLKYNISIQNHSYGTNIDNYYGAGAASYDQLVNDLSFLMPVFSAGNSGILTPSTGSFANIAGFANLTGEFKMAKNSIVVGATDSFYNVALLSSKGPAFDGRIKPELVAFSDDGSSGAAALVSGAAALLQQSFKDKYHQLPDASLIKAILLNSADDIGREHVDFDAGFGSLNVYKAKQGLDQEKYFTGSLTNLQTKTFALNVAPGTSLLKITLCWTDPAGEVNIHKALVNDLDVELVNNTTNEIWKPWVLSSYPHPDSLTSLPARKKDALNNVEQITLAMPVPGNYTVTVRGVNIKTSAQNFSIAYQLDEANKFLWTYPTHNQNLNGGEENIARWESTFETTGALELSEDNGKSWNLIEPDLDLSTSYAVIAASDTCSLGLLRMKINENYYYSDTFTISKMPETKVIFNCIDSVSINWIKAKGADGYTLYTLDDNTFRSYKIVTDTTIVLKTPPSPFLAVAPIIKDKTGLRSYGFNYTLQGIGCFINGFTADLIDDEYSILQAAVGDIGKIKQVVFEKITPSGTIALNTFNAIDSGNFIVEDHLLINGANVYRVKVVLKNGGEVFSDKSVVYHLLEDQFLLFPNPLSSNEGLKIVSNYSDSTWVEVYSMTGGKLTEARLKDQRTELPPLHLPKGLYLYRILYKGEEKKKGKLVVN